MLNSFEQLTQTMKPRVVVTGIGAVSPNGIGREAFWSATLQGKSGVRQIQSFDAAPLPVRIAGEIADFDPLQYLSEKDAANVSRVVPLAIAAAAEALEDAGLDASAMPIDERRRTAVMLGSGGGGQEFVQRQLSLYLSGHAKQCSVYTIPSATMGTLASEISMQFGFRGFSHVVTTGCTSSTDALGYAAQNIQCGVADTVICGGADAPLSFFIMKAFTLMRIMTASWNEQPERGSRPFSADRDGFVLGEGGWMFVVERADLAQARGAHIYGEIAGYGSTCEAFHRVRLEENGEEPARAISLALRQAGLSAQDVGYVNLHGTSTVLNDRIETRALKLALGERAYQVPCSALKSMIGHPQGACGAAGVAATLLAMRDNCLPPTINLDVPDPECDLDYIPRHFRPAKVNHAVCNCIAFGSKNSALALSRWVA
ncbi:MAG TPA: beta-ketoacyl-[acyl-carrier-protein] synthase family protein [Terriglobia bacterium]|nr:beta-ketoacyl-[acyl-carrier-protein] synthase family protein [Terriglobia bacterium]